MVALTRICRTIVAIMRGGNFCGAAWQRPQFARYRRSPSIRRLAESISVADSALVALAEEEVPGLGTLAATAPRADANIAIQISCKIFVFIVPFPAAKRSGRRSPFPRYSSLCGRTNVHNCR